MNGRSLVYSAERAIQDESVTFIVDTNILIEFEPIDQIDWGLLCPSARSVQIVVPATVVHEMDKHKKNTGRLRRRALEFNGLLREVEDGDGERTSLKNESVELSLVLMPRYARDELPGEKLSFTIADDLIVAEAVRFTRDHENAIFLADDNNARRTAWEMGIRVARPAEEWRRREPRDPRDARIEELERQLGAVPRLTLSLLGDDESAVVFEPLYEYEISHDFCDQVAEAILARNPAIGRDELLWRHNLQDGQERKRGLRIPLRVSVSVEDIDRYCRDYEEYKACVFAWTRKLPNEIGKLEFAAPIQLEIENVGEAFAEDVEIAVCASTGFGFIPNCFVRSYLEMNCKCPKPPSTTSTASRLPTLFEHQRLNRRDPFAFSFGDRPSEDGSVSRISYECERFRHGTSSVLQTTLYKHDNSPSGGQLVVRASSASLADPIEARCPIRVEQAGRSADFKEHLLRRLFFFPKDVREVIAEVFEHY